MAALFLREQIEHSSDDGGREENFPAHKWPCAPTPPASQRWPQCGALHPLRIGTKHGRWRFQQGRAGDRFQFDARQGGTEMPLNPNIAVLLRRIETMPLATYQPGETVIAAGTKTGRLLILKKGAVTIRKNGTVIAEVTEPGAVFGELSALLNQPHTADVRTLEASE